MIEFPTHLQSLDRIMIEDLAVRTVIGIFDRERDRCQEVKINITLWTDTRGAASSDRIEDAIDYRDLTKQIIDHVAASSCLLLERLVEEVSALVLENSAIEAAQSGEMNKKATSAAPLSAWPRRSARVQSRAANASSPTSRKGSRVQRVSSSPGRGGVPQNGV